MATATVAKVSDMVKVFNGEGDVCAWLQKVELVAKLTQVKNVAAFLPLYLEGSALAVYLELSDADKEDEGVIKRKLVEAFSDSRFVAFGKLKVASWTGEPVDVFANEIRRMARASGFVGVGLEEIVKLTFVTGFPENISLELQQTQGIDRMSVSDIMGKARILASTARSSRASVTDHGVVASSVGGRSDGKEPLKCFRCNGPHLIRDCPDRRKIVCFKCRKEGHIASRCTNNRQSVVELRSSAGDRSSSDNMCAGASLTSSSRSTSVARVIGLHNVPLIDVAVDKKRCRAMVDTGCTTSLVTSRLVARWTGESTMVAIDGHVVRCKGVSEVSLDIGNDHVVTTVTVVDKIVGDVDVVLGMDVIQQLGGVLVSGDRVQFGNLSCSVQCRFQAKDAGVACDNQRDHIVDKDFEAWFDGKDGRVRRRNRHRKNSSQHGSRDSSVHSSIHGDDGFGDRRQRRQRRRHNSRGSHDGGYEQQYYDGRHEQHQHQQHQQKQQHQQHHNRQHYQNQKQSQHFGEAARSNLQVTVGQYDRHVEINKGGAADRSRHKSDEKWDPSKVPDYDVDEEEEDWDKECKKIIEGVEFRRVKRSWLTMDSVCAATCDLGELHQRHHFGVERTWYLAKQVDPAVTKEAVKKVVRECKRCQSIDPASVTHEPGELGVDQDWTRLAVDVTHYRGVPYLSIVDCGPGRFALWRELKNETSHAICKELEQIFCERGPADEVLMDNATAFRSVEMSEFLRRWNTSPYYRAAYRASGNGIVERNHRTIKAIAERGRVSPMEAVFWYNSSPRDRQKEETIPQRSVFNYVWRHPEVVPCQREQSEGSAVSVGEEVWVKPASAKCTAQWGRGRVSRINSANNIEVDGVPRHVLDLRPVVHGDAEDLPLGEATDPDVPDRRYPQRERRAPVWAQDYVM